MLAVIIPVYNEEKGLARHMRELDRILTGAGVACRYMLVDDGSKDASWREICALSAENPRFSGIRFARNFGKETAVCAGLDAIDADRYLVMDSDLQHPPAYIPEMMAVMDRTGCDVVDGVKATRGTESLKSRFLAKAFYGTLQRMTGLALDNSSDFKLMDRGVVNALRSMTEHNRFFRGLVSYTGFVHETVYFDTADRDDGSSRFSVKSLVRLAWNAVLSYTAKPLFFGFFCAALFFAGLLADIIVMLCRPGTGSAGWILFAILLGGTLLSLLGGILGAYLARIYDEVKGRPVYILSRRVENGEERHA